LGFEVQRIVEVIDVRLARIEVGGANQVAELRSEMERLIIALLDRIEAIENSADITAEIADDRAALPDEPNDPDGHLFEDNPVREDWASDIHDIHATSAAAEPGNEAENCAATPNLPVAVSDQLETIPAFEDTNDLLDTRSKSVNAEQTGKIGKPEERNFWKQVREQIFKVNLDLR
jgi:hypothetical protein